MFKQPTASIVLMVRGATRVRTHSQYSMSAARPMADKKTVGHLSYLVATRRQPLSLPNMISIRLRRLSYLMVFLRCFRPGMQGRIPLSLNASLNQSAS